MIPVEVFLLVSLALIGALGITCWQRDRLRDQNDERLIDALRGGCQHQPRCDDVR